MEAISIKRGMKLNWVGLVLFCFTLTMASVAFGQIDSISGYVYGPDGAPLPDASVYAWSDALGTESSAISNASGFYQITGLAGTTDPASGYTVMLEFWDDTISQNYYYYYPESVVTGRFDVNFTVPSGTISGYVYDSGGAPIPDAEMYAWSEALDAGSFVYTDASGFYQFTRLVETADPASGYIVEAYAHNTSFQYPELVVTGRSDVVFNISSGGTISGCVRDELGDPAPDTWVYAWSELLGSESDAITDETGCYTIIGLAETSDPIEGYTVEVYPVNYPYQIYPDPVVTGADNVNFNLTTDVVGVSLTGTVWTTDDPPESSLRVWHELSGVEVEIWSDATFYYDYQITDPMGEFAFSDLPPAGDYIVAVYSPDLPPIYYDRKMSEEMADPVDLTEGAVSLDVYLDLDPSALEGVIKGAVTVGGAVPDTGLWVEAWTPDYEFVSDTVTDAEGNYQIFGLDPNQQYIVSAWPDIGAGAYYGAAASVLSGENATPVNPSSTEMRNIDISVGAAAIYGKVTLNGAAYPGAWVEAWDPDTGAWFGAETLGTLENDRNYAIEGVIPGTYEVSVYTYEGMPLPSQPATVTASASGVANFELANFQGNSISGTVSNLSADETAVISAWSPSNDYYGDVLIVGAGSPVQYTIADLPAASDYIVEIYPDFHLYQVYPLGYDWSESTPVDITAGSKGGIDFQLVDTAGLAGISGVITLAATVETAEIIWVNAESLSTGYGSGVEIEVTPQDCADAPCDIPYTIGGLVSGNDYIVSIWPETSMPLYYDNSSDYETAVPVATNRNDVNFTLSRGTTISGKIIDGASNAGVGGVFVSAWSESTFSWGETYSSNDGTYTIPGLYAANDFIVEADGGELGFFYYGAGGKTVRDYTVAAPVSTLDDPPEGIDIAIQAGKRIIGKVLNASGKPISGVWVSAWSDKQLAGNESYTNINGEFTISGLPEGLDYEVSVWPDWGSDYLPGFKNNVKTCSTDCNPMELILSKNSGTLTVSGKVTDANDPEVAVAGAVVEVWSESIGDMGGYAWAETSSDGAYSINRIIPASDYELTVWPPLDSNYSVYTETKPRDISISRNIDIELGQGGAIRGTVSLPDGASAAGAWVFVYSETSFFWNYDTTDRNGHYEIPQVPNGLGDYLITVILEGYLEATEAPTAFPTADVDFQLADGGVISGLVTAQGQAVAGAAVEITRVSNTGETLFWATSTGPDGGYAISGIPATDNAGQEIANYQVAARADGYPTKTTPADKKANQQVNILLARGAGNTLSGTVENISDPALANTYVIVNAINANNPNDWAWTQTSDDGSFSFTELSPSTDYFLRFTAHVIGDDFNEIYDQWRDATGNGVNETVSGVIPDAATTHATDAPLIGFRFDVAKKRNSPIRRPGVVRNMRAGSTLVQKLTRATSEKITRSPNVTIQWDPTLNGGNEKYYYAFNNDANHVINKRNANKPGLTKRKVTSRALKGDYVKFFAHVAAEDNRGRIGPTAPLDFWLDTEPPKNPTVKTDANSQARTTGSVLLNLGATNATEMYISDVNFGQGGKWENYSATKQWKLASGGDTTIYVQFRDEAQNISRTSITLKAPTGNTHLGNAIVALKVLTGVRTGSITGAQYTAAKGGVSDSMVDLRDVIVHLQKAAGIR